MPDCLKKAKKVRLSDDISEKKPDLVTKKAGSSHKKSEQNRRSPKKT